MKSKRFHGWKRLPEVEFSGTDETAYQNDDN